MPVKIQLRCADDWPAYPDRREIERLAAADRESLGCRFGEPCNPRHLVDNYDIHCLLETYDNYEDYFGRSLVGFFNNLDRWSGVTAQAPSCQYVIMLNPMHSKARRTLTLAHEFGHVVLCHKPFAVSVSNNWLPQTRYNDEQERDATLYGLGVLLPYAPLRQMLQQGATVRGIAHHYGISSSAVEMKMKLTGLWGLQSESPL